jgi:hypothetical protein
VVRQDAGLIPPKKTLDVPTSSRAPPPGTPDRSQGRALGSGKLPKVPRAKADE